jgi:photosystem II stability/assembly factor-like uncharacterized protein
MSYQSICVLLCLTLGILPAQAAPSTGPARPFTVDWQVVVAPASNLPSMAFAPDGTNGIVLEADGGMLRTEDGGKTWVQASIPADITTELRAGVFIGAATGVVVGDGGAILRTEDAGKSWQRVILPDFKIDLRAVVFNGAATGVAVGNGAILRTEDAGKNWQRTTLPAEPKSDLRAVVFNSATTGIAIGSRGTILRTEDAGKNWQHATKPADFNVDVRAVVFTDATAGIVVGRYRGNFKSILRTEDGGKTWQGVSLPAGVSNLDAVAFTSPMNGIAVSTGAGPAQFERAGGSATAGSAILWTEDGGRNWKRAATPNGFRQYLSFVFTSTTTAIAVGRQGAIIRSEDGGKSWQQAAIPADFQTDLAAVILTGGTTGVAIGESRTILRTEDGGKSWQMAATLPDEATANLSAVVTIGATTALTIGDGGTIVRTEDGGKSWRRATVPPDFDADLNALTFTGLTGVAVGDEGAILRTEDGGKNWWSATVPDDFESNLNAVAFTGATAGVAIGDEGAILRTEDAGKKWQPATIPAGFEADLSAVAFTGATTGVAIGGGGAILRTEDGGKNWQPATVPTDFEADLSAVVFTGATTAIAIGDKGAILRTEDGGKNWQAAIVPAAFKTALNAVVFTDATTTGVAIGDDGAILRTEDGGKSWQRAAVPADFGVNLSAVAFSATGTGLAIGAGGATLRSRDGGRTWMQAPTPQRIRNADLTHLTFIGKADLAIAVGDRGARLMTRAPNYAAYLYNKENAGRLALGGHIEIDLHPVDDEEDKSSITAVEYNVIRRDGVVDWRSIGPLPRLAPDGHWRGSWLPSDHRIADGSDIQHRVVIGDGGPPLPATMLNLLTYRSLVDRIVVDHPTMLWSVTAATGLVALYLLPVLMAFWFAPVRLAVAGGGTLDAMSTVAESGPSWSKAISTLLRQLALPWFKRRPRVRRAWIASYEKKATRFDKLAKEVRQEFLEQDDVLDAWIFRRLTAANAALDQLLLYRARRTYIPFPIRIGDAEIGETVDKPGPINFAKILERDRAIFAIVGGGGCGKTTLACALARWALSKDTAPRLGIRPMIPVIVAEDTEDLAGTVTAILKRMLGGEEELAPDIVNALLKRKRILVIIDALSERSTETQRHIEQLYGSDTSVNALIVTTRREPDFGPVERTLVYPLPLDLRLLIPFIMEHLQRQQLAAHFSPQQQLILAQRILQIVEAGGGLAVTPLLIILFVDAAVARAAHSSNIEGELPINVPEVYLSYLERLNPTDVAAPNRVDHEEMQEAAFVLAQASLGSELVPTDFRRDDAVEKLERAGLVSGERFIDRLISNGIIQERIVANLRILRFQLDPVAEYLTAIANCRELGTNKASWRKKIAQITAMPGYPEDVRGFLTALTVCYTSYEDALKLPSIQFPWKNSAPGSSNSEGPPVTATEVLARDRSG